ncbi:hypothetical protein N7488_007124 [Penicillium malachiteum]|nr:hypothetical protein N7488_007124 [Penicillium malachiteum]
MSRMQSSEGPNAPSAHVPYDSWRPPYHPPYEHHAEPRRLSALQGPAPPQAYPGPVIPNRELPQLPPAQLSPDGPYARPNGLPAPAPPHPVPEPSPVHTTFRPPLNGSPHEASPTVTNSDYRSRLGYQPSESSIQSESTPPLPAHISSSQYMQPPPMLSGGSIPYDAYYGGQPPGARQRKANRATQACDQCRSRKAKCDEGRPACSHCKENNLGCVYKEIPPHKQEKGTQQVLDRLNDQGENAQTQFDKVLAVCRGTANEVTQLGSLPTQVAHLTHLVRELQALLPGGGSSSQTRPPLKVESNKITMKSDVSESTPSFSQEPQADLMQPLDPFEEMKKESNEGELSIPVEHTTAAHKLLKWPTIKELISPKEYDEDYVMRLEEERGLITVRGQGENSFSADGTRLPVRPRPAIPGHQATVSIPQEGVYNAQEEPLPSDSQIDITNSGYLNLDPVTARKYFKGYLERMHRLHPFIDEDEVTSQFEDFLRFYSPWSHSHRMDRVNSLCQENGRGAKRKRSYDDPHGVRGESAEPMSPYSGQLRVGMNIENARILLMLAVGAICETPSPLPGPIMDEEIDYLNQYIPLPWPPLPPPPPPPPGATPANKMNGNSQDSPSSPERMTFFTSPMIQIASSFSSITPEVIGKNAGALSRRSISNVRDEYGNVKNLQVIPGLALYGYATAILGHLQGGVELEHVQASLLAGIYAGQLAHPFQSHGWISQAARGCQVLIRQRRFERMDDGPRKDLYIFAFWTCLQLESDLLAELDIPASGISRSESRMGLPKGIFTIQIPDSLEAPNTRMMLFYSAQIHLRKVLNRVHTDLYKVEKKREKEKRWSSTVQETLSMNLDLWRESLPTNMKWKDADLPANDINEARMRGKYYGARYIIHRPLLYHALHFGKEHVGVDGRIMDPEDSPPAAEGSQSKQTSPLMSQATTTEVLPLTRMPSDVGTITNSFNPDFPNGWSPPDVHMRELPPKLLRACKVCVDSAILSTEAFDGVEGRLVVTNIFGTAHAQFGNMLVLSATYQSFLSDLIPRETLKRLLRRTIKFLLVNRHISPTLRADARILTEIYEKIFGTH